MRRRKSCFKEITTAQAKVPIHGARRPDAIPAFSGAEVAERSW